MSNPARSSSGGVRNLRAMFEQKDDSSTSPPDRGRSPAGSYGGGSNGTSPRPLSKVRTSFVTVERSGQFGGQLGLRKETDPDLSVAKSRPSFSIDEEADPVPSTDKKEATNTGAKVKKMIAVTSATVPESAIAATPPIESAQRTGYMNGNGVKSAAQAAKPNGSSEKKSIQTGAAVAATSTENIKPSSPTKSTSKTASAKATTKPAPISTTKASTTTKSSSSALKSPAVPKTPTSPTKVPKSVPSKAPASKSTVHKSPERKPAKPVAPISAPKATVRPATSSTAGNNATKKPAPVPSATGFIKPRPKSPTRPVKLPASLMAQTASSQSKLAGSTSPPRRQSNAAANTAQKLTTRSPSRISLAPKNELRRTKSSIHSDRPALGRPPTSTQRSQASRQSLPKQVAPADEGFLARMMRPTTSSASKVLDKPPTPPRERAKSTTRPQTRDSMGSHKEHEGLKGSPSTKKLPLLPKLAKFDPPKIAKEDTEQAAIVVGSEGGDSLASSTATEVEAPVLSDTIIEEEPAVKSSAPESAASETSPIAEAETLIPAGDSTASEEKESVTSVPAEDTPAAKDDAEVIPEELPTDSETVEPLQEPENLSVEKETPTPVDPIVEDVPASEPLSAVNDSKVESVDILEAGETQAEAMDDEGKIEDPVKATES